MIFTKKKKYKFNPVSFSESTEYISNPSMGWYHIYPFCLSKEPDLEEMYWCLEKEETLVLVLIDIGDFRKESLSKDAVLRFQKILDFFVKNEREMILRITYDREGNCVEKEPEFLSQIKSHMEALGTVLREYREHLLLVQGLCIGNWGEMHGSKYLSDRNMKKLYQIWRSALGDEIVLAVRTPLQWRLLHEEHATVSKNEKLGVFNDGMFGSSDDLGTYKNADTPIDTDESEECSWEKSWPRDKELAFLQELTLYTPYGGEAVGEAKEGELKRAVEEFRCTHTVYLNKAHDPKRFEMWKLETWKSEDEWNGIDGYTYIGNHLGYRLVVRNATLTGKKEQKLSVELENTGFASFFRSANLTFYLETEKKVPFAEQTVSVPEIDASTKQMIWISLADLLQQKQLEWNQKYILKIQIRDAKNHCIRLANAPDAEYLELGVLLNG